MRISYTKLSKKALKRAAKMLAKQAFGCSLVDEWDEIWKGIEFRFGWKGKEAQKKFDEKVEEEYEKLTKDIQYRIKNTTLFEIIAKEIGRKLHKFKGGEPPLSRSHKKKPEKEKNGSVGNLLKQLKDCKDQAEKRKLRRKLRRYGHKGGLK